MPGHGHRQRAGGGVTGRNVARTGTAAAAKLKAGRSTAAAAPVLCGVARRESEERAQFARSSKATRSSRRSKIRIARSRRRVRGGGTPPTAGAGCPIQSPPPPRTQRKPSRVVRLGRRERQ